MDQISYLGQLGFSRPHRQPRLWAILRAHLVAMVVICGNFSSTASAQELGLALPDKTDAPSSEVVRVVAVTQFAEGRAVRTEAAGAQTDLKYQTPLYEGDRVETTAGSVTKLATRSGCLVILRGEGALAAPVGKKTWRMRAESLRLICRPHHENETFGVANRPVVLKEGEVLFITKRSNERADENSLPQVLLLSGAATVYGHALQLHKLYSIDANSIRETSPQPNERDLRQLNLDHAPPREAYVWPALPTPDKLYTARVIFGPVFGFDHVNFDYSELSQKGLRGTGPRLQLHLRTKEDHSLIIAATFREAKDESRNGSPGSPPPDGVSNQLDEDLLEVGYRNRHDRWWSPYWRIGAGFTKDRLNYVQTSQFGGTFANYTYEFYVLSATYGLDAHLTPHFLRPFGLYAGLEGQVIQSIFRGGRINENAGGYNGGGGAIPPEPWRMTTFNVAANFGLQYDF